MTQFILPDETIYSAVARGAYGPLTDDGTDLLRYYATSEASSSGLFHSLPSKLAVSLGFSRVRDAASRHTLLPYFCAFLPSQLRIRVVAHASGKSPLPRQAFRGGFVSVAACLYLRYCPDCVHYDRTRFGLTYWHRVHQLPGVNRCIRHRKMLLISHVRQSADRRFTLVTAESALIQAVTHTRCRPLMHSEFAERIERISAEALSTGFSESKFLSDEHYESRLSREFRLGRNVAVAKLNEQFMEFAKGRRLILHQLGHPDFWLNMHLTREAGFASPTEHIVMQEFLRAEVRPVQEPFQDGF
jgi:TniQ